MPSGTSDQTVAITVLPPSASFVGPLQTWIFEAVGDIEIVDSVELSTEPGVMGRIGPFFPRGGSFRVRVRDNDPRTPTARTARAQHQILRSLVGSLVYVDARASPPERISWTFENVRAVDDNSAKNAYDVEVTLREIIGGDFSEIEIFTEKGLVPVEVVSPEVLGIGNQELTITMKEARLTNNVHTHPNDRGTPNSLGRQVAATNIYSRYNENAIADVTANSKGQGQILDSLEDDLFRNFNRIRIFGGVMPQVPGCTHLKIRFRALDVDFYLGLDATINLQFGTLVVKESIQHILPNQLYFLKGIAKEQSVAGSRRTDESIRYPDSLDCIFIIDTEGLPFVTENFPQFTIMLMFIGGVA